MRQRARHEVCPAELHTVSGQETWQQKGQLGQGEAVRKKARAGNMTPNFILTPINQSCSGACTRLCCPPPHAGSIWNPSEHRPERAPRHGDPVGLSGSKREAIFLFSPQKKMSHRNEQFSRLLAWALCRKHRGKMTAFVEKGNIVLTQDPFPSVFSTSPAWQNVIHTWPQGEVWYVGTATSQLQDQDYLLWSQRLISAEGWTTNVCHWRHIMKFHRLGLLWINGRCLQAVISGERSSLKAGQAFKINLLAD